MHDRSIRVTMGLVFMALMLVGGLSVGASLWAIRAQQHDALVINLAGRQRMLSQKTAREARLALQKGQDPYDLAPMHTSIHEFEKGLQTLLDGGQLVYARVTISVPPATAPAFRAALDEVQATWEPWHRAAHAVMENEPGSPAFTQGEADLERLSDAILEKTDRAVRVYQRAAEARVARLRWIQLGFLLAGGLVLALGFGLILTQVLRPVGALEAATRRMGRGDLDHPIRVEVRNEVGRLASSFDDMRMQLKARVEEMTKLQTAVEQSADIIFITDRDGTIQYVNPAFEKITGYSEEEALGKTPRILKSGLMEREFFQRQWSTILSGEVFRAEIIDRKKDGQLFYYDQTITPLKDTQGHITHFVSTGKDVTKRKWAQEALRERADLMSRLATLSETLNQPLATDEVVATIGQGAMALSAADRAAIYLRQPDDTVACPWSHGLSPAYVERVTARARELPGGRLMESPEPVLLPDMEALSELPLLQDLARAEGYRAAGLWPLVYEERTVAAVGCYHDAPHAWSEAEQEVMEAFCRQAVVALENARLFEALQTRLQELSTLAEVSTALRGAAAVREMGPLLAAEAGRLVQADAALVCLVDEAQQRIVTVGVAGLPAEAIGRDHGMEEGITGLVVRSGTVYRSANLAKDPMVAHRDLVAGLGPGLCVPLRTTAGEVVGTLLVARCRDPESEAAPFRRDDKRLLITLAEMAANALQRARAYEELEASYVQTVLALSNAMDARDTDTAGHSQRLAAWAEATAWELGCSEDEIEAIRWGALLHDIGKIGVPDRILQKPGLLDDDEWEVMERHPDIGAEIVAPVRKLENVAPIIRAHQEHWDGSGYPDGLEGEEIPLGARVLAVADAYDAITDERPYKEAHSHEEAVAKLTRCAGTQFDPQVVEVFLRVLEHDVDITWGGR